MDDLKTHAAALIERLPAAIDADPLAALRVIGALHREVADAQRRAAQAVAHELSWAEVGAVLGVSRQAAHQKYCVHRAVTNCGPTATDMHDDE